MQLLATKSSVISQTYCCPINIRKNWGGKTCNAEAAERYTEVTEPSILVINSNTICIWYLLDALSPKRRVWQTDKSYFHNTAQLKGAINLSPTWFQQGHGLQNGFLEVSWLLKSRMENTSAREWVNQISDTNALLSVILHVIHPQMYAGGREALICLGKQVEQQADSDMSSMYSSMSMMVNQATCYHRDINGQDPWYDMLVTVGNYMPLDFVIPTLNLQLHYNPGSALEHGVGAVDSDRACLVYYMHANVHQSVHVPMCQSLWMDDLLPTPVPTGELLI
ncbi:hypothetical protein F5J12DRAFT_781662 [Pisolithus orientalis]|uniref:uncharacterized protein n=1 Tax=Pisolithus orientalis TaxID=936130 RepID=UPI002224ABFA|nr:uncharacterized protein F5J12DRAFT_781662 [Pisolithus orientalis]KAI6012804.1 hypothetical protein F5J12DRAFT_781662 [Pisolithus orientalis]